MSNNVFITLHQTRDLDLDGNPTGTPEHMISAVGSESSEWDWVDGDPKKLIGDHAALVWKVAHMHDDYYGDLVAIGFRSPYTSDFAPNQIRYLFDEAEARGLSSDFATDDANPAAHEAYLAAHPFPVFSYEEVELS